MIVKEILKIIQPLINEGWSKRKIAEGIYEKNHSLMWRTKNPTAKTLNKIKKFVNKNKKKC